MRYQSTRDCTSSVSAAEAIARGISKEGGLFVPETLPALSLNDLSALIDKKYVERATDVLKLFLTDFSSEEIADCTSSAYHEGNFRHLEIAPLHELRPGVNVLELWHGPTCAFKDMALQILPHFMRVAAKKTAGGKEIVILVATSGDTGKAALEGFKDAPNTKILVFYPQDGVSPMQKLQMTTQEGGNVGVCAIHGNFDDAQTGVKKIFTDPDIQAELAKHNAMFSSANSINWGRLVPQIVYYISSYCDLVKQKKIKLGDAINVVVPTGNFGNILAAYYAKKMGLPIAKFICASNRNRVLTDFFRTGEYNRNREFYTTTSPSMDILISSNLERLLFDLSGHDDALVRELLGELSAKGSYTIPASMREKLSAQFYGRSADDEQVAGTIAHVFKDYGYLCDTHTAVGIHVYDEYVAATGDTTPTVIASTANPYKFSASVLKALGKHSPSMDEFDTVDELHRVTGCEIPAPLAGLKGKKVRFSGSCDKQDMKQVVFHMLGMD